MGRFTKTWGFPTLGVGTAFDVFGTEGQIITKQDTSREFDIKTGVRQGCVLSPTLFSYVLEVALQKWREQFFLQQDGVFFFSLAPFFWRWVWLELF